MLTIVSFLAFCLKNWGWDEPWGRYVLIMALTSSSVPKAMAPQGLHGALVGTGTLWGFCQLLVPILQGGPIEPSRALGTQIPKPVCSSFPPMVLLPHHLGAWERWGSACLSRAGKPARNVHPCRHGKWAEEPAIFKTPTHGCKIRAGQY